MKEFTFSFLKPDVSMSYSKEIFKIIEKNKFIIIDSKKTFITEEICNTLFNIKKIMWEKDRFQKYIDFMISGPIIALILEKESAIKDFRELMGNDPDPLKNPENSIRRKFGSCILKNAIHGSKTLESFEFESSHFF